MTRTLRYRTGLTVAAVLLLSMTLIGCQAGMSLVDPNLTAARMAEIADLAVDYDEKAMEVASALLELEEAEAEAEADIGTSARFTDLFVPSGDPDKILPDGTEVYVVRELLDKGTPDEEDDEILSTRYFMLDGELVYREVVIRPMKPAADWSVWDDGAAVVHYGESHHYAGSSTEAFRTGSLEVTWEKAGDDVHLVQIVKENVHQVTMTTVITTISIDEDVATKEQIRIRVTDGDEIVIQAFVYEQYEEDGILKTKIIRDDGTYAIRWEEDGTWYTLIYSADNVLLRCREETGTLVERSVTIYIYDETGSEIVETRLVDITFEAGDDGSVVVTKKLDDGREIELSIREGGWGYIVERNGYKYVVCVDLTTDTVTLSDIRGNLLGTITLNDDGSWTVLTSGGDVADVEI